MRADKKPRSEKEALMKEVGALLGIHYRFYNMKDGTWKVRVWKHVEGNPLNYLDMRDYAKFCEKNADKIDEYNALDKYMHLNNAAIVDRNK